MTEITDGSGVTYPAEAYQAVFMEAHRLRARLVESEAENARLRADLDNSRAAFTAQYGELERLRAVLFQIADDSAHADQYVRWAQDALDGASGA